MANQLNTKFQAVQAGNLGGALIRIDGRALLPHVFHNREDAAEFLSVASEAGLNLFIGMQPEEMADYVNLWRVTVANQRAKQRALAALTPNGCGG